MYISVLSSAHCTRRRERWLGLCIMSQVGMFTYGTRRRVKWLTSHYHKYRAILPWVDEHVYVYLWH